MAVYAVGDIQGCAGEFRTLLDRLQFDVEHDCLWLVGDLVNRGPNSLGALRLVKELGSAARCVLGNHDLHLLALAFTDSAPVTDHNLQPVLEAPDRAELLDWLRQQPLAYHDPTLNTVMVHAGVLPAWSVTETLHYADEVHAILSGPQPGPLLEAMYEPKPERWSPDLHGYERLRFIINSLTRMRYCHADGRLDFRTKLAPGSQAAGLLPWFRLPERVAADTRIVFGHWSTLGLLQEPGLLGLDTGCVWGGTLTAVRLDADAPAIQVSSQQPLHPGPDS